jgi:hypothetical protein
MSPVKVTPRDADELRCPYCHDDVSMGPSCSGCAARYHAECAQTFGACAIPACLGTLDLESHTAQVLPRLTGLARRIGRWTPPMGGPRALILDLPAPRAVRDDPEAAARLVGDLLGQTTYDGRMRVLSPFPEPLIRVRSEAEAVLLRGQLSDVGLASITPPLSELVKPFDPFQVARYEVGDDVLRVEDAEGQERTLDLKRPRLVFTGSVVTLTESRTTRHLKRSFTGSYGSGAGAVRTAPKARPGRDQQLCAYVYTAADAQPLRFLHRELELVTGGTHPKLVTEGQRFRALLDELKDPNDQPYTVPPVLCSNPSFMTAVDAGGGKRSNAAFVALVARLEAFFWQARRVWKADA